VEYFTVTQLKGRLQALPSVTRLKLKKRSSLFVVDERKFCEADADTCPAMAAALLTSDCENGVMEAALKTILLTFYICYQGILKGEVSLYR
jgi:hypothetical protein